MNDGRTCSRCGAPAELRQEYCLECGEQLVSPRRSIHWLWPTGAAGLVAAGGAAVAIAAGSNSTSHSTIVAFTPLRPAPARSVPSERALTHWPLRNGYTIVLTVIPTTAGEPAVAARARRASRTGLPDVGVLTSRDYASLHPGYFIVFSGVYDALDEALTALPRARSRFRSAYVQQIAH